MRASKQKTKVSSSMSFYLGHHQKALPTFGWDFLLQLICARKSSQECPVAHTSCDTGCDHINNTVSCHSVSVVKEFPPITVVAQARHLAMRFIESPNKHQLQTSCGETLCVLVTIFQFCMPTTIALESSMRAP